MRATELPSLLLLKHDAQKLIDSDKQSEPAHALESS